MNGNKHVTGSLTRWSQASGKDLRFDSFIRYEHDRIDTAFQLFLPPI